MARQAGPLYFTGTIDDITFYKMEGTYYARKKSSLDRKQFRTDPRFKRSRASAARFGEASKLASEVYYLLPKEARGKGVIGKLTGKIGRLLREGTTPEQVLAHFQQQVVPEAQLPDTQPQAKEATLAQSYLSEWKIAATGELISKKAKISSQINSNRSPTDSSVLYSYISPLIE